MFIELNSVADKTETVNLSSSGPCHRSKANKLEKRGKMPLLQWEAAKRV